MRPPPAQASSKSMVELPTEPALSMSFDVSQLLAAVDELMNLYENMVERRCRGEEVEEHATPEDDSAEMKQQCAALHKLAMQGMLPPRLASVYAGKPATSCPLEHWRAAGCPGLQPEELLEVIDQLMQVYEAMVKDSVQEAQPLPRQRDCKLDSSIESLEKIKRLTRQESSLSRRHKTSRSTLTLSGPSTFLQQEDIARAINTTCDHRDITEEAVLPLTAVSELPCRTSISVMDKLALWSARQVSDSESDPQAVVRTISNSDMTPSPARGSSPDSGSPVPTPPWAGCPLDAARNQRHQHLHASPSLGHLASPPGVASAASDAGENNAAGPGRVARRGSGGDSSAGSFSLSKSKVMQQVLLKLEQVEQSLANERHSTQELAAKYENILVSRAEAHSKDVKVLEESLATALKDRRRRHGVGSTESGGTSSKRSQSGTLSSSNASSSTGSRSGDKSARSPTPTSGSDSRAASQKSPSSVASPDLRTKEPTLEESLSDRPVDPAFAAGIAPPLPTAESQIEFLAAPAQQSSFSDAPVAQEAMPAPEPAPARPPASDDLLKQFADAAWASRYIGLLPVAALGAILNDLLEAAPQDAPQSPRS